ncbi:MAG: DmsC/YnfH family molybdoenzyme membrane anchor subunit [Xanthomonadales bacterium]|nr:DmsC/YnfH family molybdoenzyme membrane anchor subunit [Xanthomonadales bacterium]
MHPAYSVILFTCSSGAGYGLLIWLATAWLGGGWNLDPPTALAASLAGLVLVTIGLLSSTFHLGHPERAWRAVSQWRSSWLSREGVAAILAYPPTLLFSAGWLWQSLPAGLMTLAAYATMLLATLTVICTAMIYASLKTIPRWSNAWVLPVYLAFSLASGGLLFAVAMSLSGAAERQLLGLVLGILTLAWLIKWGYWRFIDRQRPASDTGTATGLGHLGEVRQLEAPHTSENYLLKEMGYAVARKHAARLRRFALTAGLAAPAALLLLATAATGAGQSVLLLFAALLGLTGISIERWLFFAEARHQVTLYYGRSL